MTRVEFDRHLRELKDELLEMGSMVEKALARAIDALKKRDMEMARLIVEDDSKINKKRFDIEEKCVELIATQQPLARDLRQIVSILHMTVDLERMGDHAEGIARINIRMGDEPLLKPLIDVPRMAQLGIDMTHRALQAFIDLNVENARAVCKADDEVDALYDQVYRELLVYMIQDPRTIQRATYLLWIAHDLERIADRATNIAERVVFTVTGKMDEVGVSKY
ncbi:MAG: phosphate signaling complex protein PhoU [Dehalococcoidia bacterium]|nr:phosphate signaling complex protein PhoU [Dehalococcoidia bacterium]